MTDSGYDNHPIDTVFSTDILGVVAETEPRRGATRYEAIIATFVGLCALCVSGYTAYMQRQQVRATVWPILEFDSNNGPIQFTLTNKGVGPAIIKHVVVKVDGEPVRDWIEAFKKLVGPEQPHYAESDMNNRVLSSGESLQVLIPRDANNNSLDFDKGNPEWVKWNEQRLHVSVEICYCSTLGECWILRAGPTTGATTAECRTCPSRSASSFLQ